MARLKKIQMLMFMTHHLGADRKWGVWEGMDERKRWLKRVEGSDGDYVVDLEKFFANLDMS